MIKSWSELPVAKLQEIKSVSSNIEDEDTKVLTIAGILLRQIQHSLLR